MTKTLTEQWREGTLPSGWYYVKDINNEIYIAHQYTYGPSICLYEEEVLSAVPSYDEYKQLVSKTRQLEKKLAIAAKALKEYADRTNWTDGSFMCVYDGKCFADEESAEEALKEMEGVK